VRFLLALFALMLLGGCAAPTLYQWGGYDQALYAGYKDPTKMEALRLQLETHVAEMEKSKQKVAPGLYAELGTLYLQSGSAEKAIALYSKERDAWPESQTMMTAMIQNLERRQQARAGGEK
jgi:hypothetical protein